MVKVEMDQEWVKLISEARSLGFKKEEISEFFENNSKGLQKEKEDK